MIIAKTKYDKNVLREINKKMMKRNLILAIILSIMMLGLGIINIIQGINENKWLIIVLGLIFCVACFFPLFSTWRTSKKNYENSIKDFNCQEYPVFIDYVFLDKKFEITIKQNNQSKTNTIMYKYIWKVKNKKDSINIYINNSDLYLIYKKDFENDASESLIKLFRKNNIIIK